MAPKRSVSAQQTAKYTGLTHPTIERAQEVDEDSPFERLKLKLHTLKSPSKVSNVVHWFRTKDLRAEDNKSLQAAVDLIKKKSGKKGNSSLLTLLVLTPAELEWHGVGEARRAFIVDNVKLLTDQLEKLGIPLVTVIAKTRGQIAQKVAEFASANDASHVFANFEYEYDELNRDLAAASVLEQKQIAFQLFHDQTVVEPGLVTNAQGEPRKVFTSFWNAWIPMIAEDPDQYYLKRSGPPPKQEKPNVKDIEGAVHNTEELDKHLGLDRKDKYLVTISKLWPAGHSAAADRMVEFSKKKISKYHDLRSNPADDCTSRMSPYFALGVISTREALAIVRETANSNKDFGTKSNGVDSWVREIAFREFYRQMVASVVPHIVMNMPQSLKLAEINNEDNEEAWERWCKGTTGMPFVDAGMRQLNAEGYMHNRLRMNVSSYLRMNLLLDYRKGMRYFANKLVDWDCCNNCFGWDPNYTVFNPVLQAERLDPEGEYIRKWIPELKNVEGKAIFDPSDRLPEAEFKKLNYPRPMIDQQEAKTRAIERFKEASAKEGKQPKSKSSRKRTIKEESPDNDSEIQSSPKNRIKREEQ